jgi:hypothetical protein
MEDNKLGKSRVPLPVYDREKYQSNSSLEKFDKSKPYVSTRHGYPSQNFNYKAEFQDDKQQIVCHNLAMEYVCQSSENKDGKVDLTQFSSKEKIEEMLPQSNEQKYVELKWKAVGKKND